MVRYLVPGKPAPDPTPEPTPAPKRRPGRPRKVDPDWLAEMRARTAEMREEARAAPKLRRAWPEDDDLFEVAFYALAASEMDPEDGFVVEAAPGFAALLCRIAGQTSAEFGPKAAAEAFRRMADVMDRCHAPAND